jgi:hypothetical protein
MTVADGRWSRRSAARPVRQLDLTLNWPGSLPWPEAYRGGAPNGRRAIAPRRLVRKQCYLDELSRHPQGTDLDNPKRCLASDWHNRFGRGDQLPGVTTRSEGFRLKKPELIAPALDRILPKLKNRR